MRGEAGTGGSGVALLPTRSDQACNAASIGSPSATHSSPCARPDRSRSERHLSLALYDEWTHPLREHARSSEEVSADAIPRPKADNIATHLLACVDNPQLAVSTYPRSSEAGTQPLRRTVSTQMCESSPSAGTPKPSYVECGGRDRLVSGGDDSGSATLCNLSMADVTGISDSFSGGSQVPHLCAAHRPALGYEVPDWGRSIPQSRHGRLFGPLARWPLPLGPLKGPKQAWD